MGRLSELAWLFGRLGTTAFGGPAAHIALVEDEVVARRHWLTSAAFLDLLGASHLIPGPNSTELVMHVGRLRAGGAGLVVAGLSFILPAAIWVTLLAVVYVRYGALPDISAALYGIKPVVIAVVLQALVTLGRTAITSIPLFCLAALSVAAVATGVHELLVLLTAGVLAVAVAGRRPAGVASLFLTWWGAATAGAQAAATSSTSAFGLWPLFLTFLKIGSVLFGSGYVLLAFLRADFVHRLGWLTEQQILDATAVGLVTPGPVFTTATFIGYLLAGVPGAVVATIGIFLPAFFFVAVSGPLVPRLRASPIAGRALDGINAASLALMLVVAWQLGRTALVDLPTIVIAVASGVLLVGWRVNAVWLIAAGAAVGVTVR